MPTTIISQHQQQVTSYWDILDAAKGIELGLVKIPAGEFQMGCPNGEEGDEDEMPQHRVTVDSFLMGQTPITQEQWVLVASWKKVAKDLNPNLSSFEGEKHPVENISWYDAIEFCARLSRERKMDYRLPTEAQWEYACRAGTTTPFHFGETLSTSLANYDGNYTYGPGEKGEYREETTPVKTFPSNPWGLYDLHGNVWEWCLDPWHESYHEKKQTDSEVWDEEKSRELYLLNRNNVKQLLNDGRLRVVRGGSWLDDPRFCRSADRGRVNPVFHDDSVGFRVVCRFPRT
jgi:formylglycine-generating enzyme required for sulfatase activity